MIAAIRIAVPVADSQFNVSTAGSAVGRRTTGATRCTILSRPEMGKRGAEMASSRALTLGSPQRKTTTVRMIHGSHGEVPRVVAGTATFSGKEARPPRQTRRNAVRQIIE